MTSGYHPLVPANEDYYERRLRELERQVRELQAGRALSAASFRGGAFRFLQDDGQPRMTLGTVTPVGAVGDPSEPYGIFEFGDGGAIVHAAREGDRGLSWPPEQLKYSKWANFAEVTAGSFTDTWELRADWPNQEVLHYTAWMAVDPNTTGEFRLQDFFSGNTTTVATLTAAGTQVNGYLRYLWWHPSLVGLNDARSGRVQGLDVLVQGRRAAGAGKVYVGEPNICQLESKWLNEGLYTSGGNPVWSG